MYFVRPENIILLCSVSQRGMRKKRICEGGGGGERTKGRGWPPQSPSLFPSSPGLENSLYSSLSFGQAAFTFCLPETTSCSSLFNDFVKGWLAWPLPIGEISYLPNKKNYLSRTIVPYGTFLSPPFPYRIVTSKLRFVVKPNFNALDCCKKFHFLEN